MVLLYLLLAAYIIAINFYSFLLVKGLRDKEKQAELAKQAQPIIDTENAEKPIAPTAEECLAIESEAEKYNYKVECKTCGYSFFRKRLNCNFSRNYRCGKCGGRLQTEKGIFYKN